MTLAALEAIEGIQSYPYHVGITISADLRLNDIYGKEHSMGDYRGKIVFLHFWSLRCPVVKTYEPKFIELQKELGGKELVQIAIASDQRELKGDYGNLRNYVKKAGLNFPIMVDPGHKVSNLFGVQVAPHCFVIDQRGVLRYSGTFDDDPHGSKGANAKPYVRDAIVALLSGKLVPVTKTTPYGCGIKPPD
jgi:thiol-disulfide isomerase/thioredoxin